MSMVMPTRPERVLGSALHILTMCCKDCPLKIFNPFRKAFYNMVSALSPSLSLYIYHNTLKTFLALSWSDASAILASFCLSSFLSHIVGICIYIC